MRTTTWRVRYRNAVVQGSPKPIHRNAQSPNHRMTLIGPQIAPPAERYLVISVALVAVRACFRVRRRSTRTSTDGPPGSSVNPWRPGRIYPAKAPCRENSWLITGWKGCDRQEWSTSPTRADFAARIVSVGLIGVLPTAADLDGGAQKSKRLSDRLKLGSRPKEFPNCNALP